MNTCPNCGKMAGVHGSVLQGCTCQWSMQAPPKREWIGLTEEEIKECFEITPDLYLPWHIYKRIEAKLKERNT